MEFPEPFVKEDPKVETTVCPLCKKGRNKFNMGGLRGGVKGFVKHLLQYMFHRLVTASSCPAQASR